MIVLGKGLVEAFKKAHSTQRKCLATRVKVLEDVGFKPRKDSDMKFKFGKCFDRVGKQVVLDACGNKVRIIGRVDFSLNTFQITHVLTHTEYDKGKWKDKKEVNKEKTSKKKAKKKKIVKKAIKKK